MEFFTQNGILANCPWDGFTGQNVIVHGDIEANVLPFPGRKGNMDVLTLSYPREEVILILV